MCSLYKVISIHISRKPILLALSGIRLREHSDVDDSTRCQLSGFDPSAVNGRIKGLSLTQIAKEGP
jgi:hypothetical protein